MLTDKIQVKVAHSPDSDDAFMFYAMRSHKLGNDSVSYEFSSAEIESLNQAALFR